MTGPDSAGAAASELEFLNKLQRILNEGLFVASYKYALILALAELSVEKTAAPDGSLTLPLSELSERFVTLYWRQAAPFVEGSLLSQNTGRQASAITKLAEFRTRAPTLAAARRHPKWTSLISDIGRLLVAMPVGTAAPWR